MGLAEAILNAALDAKPHVDRDKALKFLYGWICNIYLLSLLFSPCPNLIGKVVLAFLSHIWTRWCLW